ncbi:MAG TPA: ATP-dependent 6-phosphofructokinase [Fibrobacteria bacterium]|nr:ATP-dependent 6-phosphofructokinase [Fibrobacteria bacterium]
MTEKIGILTAGGDCPGLNAVIRAVVKAGQYAGFQTLGFKGGFEGLLTPCEPVQLDYNRMDGMLIRGGTILGAANKGRFAGKVGHGEVREVDQDILREAKANYDSLGLRALIVVGGDGSLVIAQQLSEIGMNVVGVPKTIDNDLDATDQTFGFDTAVDSATDALDRLHTTAESHGRVIILEVMGRHTGWIALNAGIAGGGDVILIPEIPFTFEAIADKVMARERAGKKFTLIVVAEGAAPRGGKQSIKGQEADREVQMGGMGQKVADEISRLTGKEARVVVLGHLQRGGAPTSFDRLLCTRYGEAAVRMVRAGQYGRMVALHGSEIADVSIQRAIGRRRRVSPDGELVLSAKALGIGFGD